MRRAALGDLRRGQIRIALLEARPAGLTTRQLVATTELTLSQMRHGIAYLREFLAPQHMQPLT
ncbi:hypothetical protein [Amycolatopsis sp. cmx-11-12]|uniref:hypothetical protein n=1 Tax=Amycolatopsis sp. cmx-11-12 TaxID=2785795 RepID=UPI003917F6BE